MLKLYVHFIIFFTTASMVMQKQIISEKEHFNLKLYILTSICRISLKDLSLKLSLFAVQNRVLFFCNCSQISFHCYLKSTSQKAHEKLPVELFFEITAQPRSFQTP